MHLYRNMDKHATTQTEKLTHVIDKKYGHLYNYKYRYIDTFAIIQTIISTHKQV